MSVSADVGENSSSSLKSQQVTAYAELHCHSNFSFLDGASDPEGLVEEAVRLGLSALALTDRNGFYGVVRFAEAARTYGLATVFGAELSLSIPGAVGEQIGTSGDLVVLARGTAGYARLGRAISEGQMAGEKGAPRFTLDRLAELAAGHWVVLTGTMAGPVTRALETEGPAAAGRCLDDLVERFGPENVAVELWDHATPLCTIRNDALARLGAERGLTVVAAMHDLTLAGRFADGLVLLAEGEVVAAGGADVVLTSEVLSRTYGVDIRILDDPDLGRIVTPVPRRLPS